MPRKSRGKRKKVTLHPIESAEAAGLRYVSDTAPGINRKRAGTGFTYVGQDGKRITDRKTLDRIRSLAIPPAYTDVWICPAPNGHIQATGRDARGRKQYRYHLRWREVRDETKFGRMLAFSRVLPAIRARVQRDLAKPTLSKEKVLSTVVQLLECTGIRVGNDEYARTNKSFGLTTLKDHHVEISGSRLSFQFRGKSGKDHEVELTDRRLARIVARCRDLPGETLFQYEENGVRQTIDSGDVNAYLREITGEDFTAKDFRTWTGTIQAVAALKELGPSATQRQAKSAILQAIDRVAEQLNNTRAVCRKYYVHPAVFDHYQAGTMLEALANGNQTGARAAAAAAAAAELSAEEEAVVRLLSRQVKTMDTGQGSQRRRARAPTASRPKRAASAPAAAQNEDRT
jgi:DNA topoisomerase I